MHSDSESEDDADFRESKSVPPPQPPPPVSSLPPGMSDARNSEQLVALQRRAALLSVMGGGAAPLLAVPASMPTYFTAKFTVLEPTPLPPYMPSSFALLPPSAGVHRCMPSSFAAGLPPYRGPQSTAQETEGLDGLAQLSTAAALEAAIPLAQDDTWRGSLVSHTGRNGVAASTRVIV